MKLNVTFKLDMREFILERIKMELMKKELVKKLSSQNNTLLCKIGNKN